MPETARSKRSALTDVLARLQSPDRMSELYPLLLLPEFHERVWGSRDLSLIYPHKTARQGGEFGKPIGEAWLTGDACRVANGPLAGQTLGDVAKKFGRELLGDAANDLSRFPLLLKFLF